MKKHLVTILLLSAAAVWLLVACSSSGGSEVSADGSSTLNTDYSDALSVAGQLALGTVQLEDTAQAVTEDQATELLTLWQAYQSLSNSDTAADAELTALVNQIEETMTPEQIQAIAAMQLTTDSMTELAQNGDFAFGGPGGFRGNGGGTNTQDGNGNNAQGGDFAGGPGGFAGGPPGGFAGGPPDGGGFAGGPGGFAGGAVDEDTIATRQAQFADNPNAFQDRMLMGIVIRLLENKTGTVTFSPREISNAVYTAVSEATGLTMDDLQAQLTEGKTLVEIIQANGTDVETVRSAIIEAINALPNAGDMDAAAIADSWLNPQPPPSADQPIDQ